VRLLCGRGKRKRAKPPPKKAKPKVATVFDCPFCGASESCACTMDVDHSLGTIRCDSCGAKYDTRISRLSDPIDVYAEWVDK
jgi:transcription elongation factor Elf1